MKFAAGVGIQIPGQLDDSHGTLVEGGSEGYFTPSLL